MEYPHLATTYFQSMGTMHDRRFYGIGCGALFVGFESHESEGGQVQNIAHLLHPPSLPCQKLAPHDTATAAAPSAPPTRAKPQNL